MKLKLITGLAFCFALSGHAQFNVNREWQQNAGHPVLNPLLNPAGLEWTNSVTDAFGNIFTVGHTYVSGQGENVYLRKRYITGGIAFQTNVNTTGTNNEYGIGVALDGSGNIWVCGATDNGGVTNHDGLLMKFNSSGVLQSTTSYAGSAGMNDIPTALVVDPTGDILMLCAGENLTSMYDYHLVKYSATGSLIYDAPYDYANLIDIPLSLDINTGTVVVGGASANTLTDWDYSVVYFDLATGGYITDTRTNLPGIGMNQPYGFKKDASQNIYLTGKGSTNGVDYNFFTVKVNPNFTIAWTRTLDIAGGEDAGSSVDIDNNGNVFVGGYSTKSNNVKQLSILKYDASGTLLWQYHQDSKDGSSDAFVKDICVNTDHAYFTAGETGKTGYKEVMVGRISANGYINWIRSIKGNEDYTPAIINLEPDGTIITTSLRDTVTGSVYIDTKYSELAFDTTRIFSGNRAVCKASELIVRFNRNAMNTAAVDNLVGSKIAEFGDLRDFLTSPAYASVISALSPICPGGNVNMVKIFPEQPTTYTSTVSRLGTTVPVPDFWTAFTLVFPSGVNIGQAQDILNTLPDVVTYCHPNYIGVFHNMPNDPLYPYQQGLHYINPPPQGPGGPYPVANINVEEAWRIVPSGGLPFVKCGVFDTGIIWGHEEFNSYNGITTVCKVIDGWNYQNNTPLKNFLGEEPLLAHGTKVAGIIGALRNNNLGIAGIAGGNNLSPNTNQGVSLYGLRIGQQLDTSMGGLFALTINYVANAIAKSADLGGSPIGYGLHLANHSWGIQPFYPPLFTDTNMTLINEAIHHANRANVTAVASRGNWNGFQPSYPACSDDDWVITVGAFGKNGLRCDPNNCLGYSAYGDLDVCAPGAAELIWFTPANGTQPSYEFCGMTSGAAPHVSGVVGLLMSYMNDTAIAGNYRNLAPEDCEYLIQRSARDTGIVGVDSLHGYGRLDAGRALQLVEKPYWDVKHFGTSQGVSYTTPLKQVYSINDTIKLAETFWDKNSPSNAYTRRRYVVKTFEISTTVFHNLPSTDTIKGYWARSSMSDVLQLFDLGTRKLFPRERAIITSCNNTSATLKGYIYQVKDTLGNPLGWWPCDTTFSCPKINSLFEYSLLVRNNIAFVGVEKKARLENMVSLFPNPTSGKQDLVIETNKQQTVSIDLYDLMGRQLKNVYTGKVQAGETRIVNDVANLPNSVYIYNIKLGDDILVKKFIKQ